MKHKLKLFVRELYARTLFHTGLHALVDRMMPRRQTVLFGHCVDEPSCNGFLPSDMKIRRERLQSVLGWFQKRYDLLPLGAGFRAVCEEPKGARSVVSLTMDDGYRDNATELPGVLAPHGCTATVFLEARPLDERQVNWSHKFFWMLSQGQQPAELARALMLGTEDAAFAEAMRRLLEEGDCSAYQLKRILKYEVPRAQRDPAIQALYDKAGGDERALCDELYMSWEEARQLEAQGFEVGGHTVHHDVLSTLDRAGAESELQGCAASLGRELQSPATLFAYPFGRRWDYNDETRELLEPAGFTLAVNTHAGTNGPGADRTQLKRIPIDDTSPMHLLVAEACGGFDLLRRFGLDLSE